MRGVKGSWTSTVIRLPEEEREITCKEVEGGGDYVQFFEQMQRHIASKYIILIAFCKLVKGSL